MGSLTPERRAALRAELGALLTLDDLHLMIQDCGLPGDRLDLAGPKERQIGGVLDHLARSGGRGLGACLEWVKARYPDATLPHVDAARQELAEGTRATPGAAAPSTPSPAPPQHTPPPQHTAPSRRTPPPPSSGDPLLDDLRQKIRDKQVLIVVGAGVSLASTKGKAEAGWVGLLKSGVQRVVGLGRAPTTRWAEGRLDDIESGDLDTMISAAETIQKKLDGPTGGEFKSWLRESVGALQVEDATVIQALHALGCPIATTNYDGLLSEVTHLPPVTWQQSSDFQRVIRGDDPGILHLHGHWKLSESVILGVRDYARVLGDGHAQAMQRALVSVKTLLFVGCGAGSQDPNLGALFKWAGQVFAGSEYRHYRLEREGDRAERQREHPPEQRVQVLSYGAEYGDLAGFLRGLAPAAEMEGEPSPITPPTVAGVKAPPDLLPLLIEAQLREHRPLPVPGSERPLDLGKSYVTLTLWGQGALGTREEHFLTRRKWEEGDWQALQRLGECPRLKIDEVLAQHPSVAILGDPGAGKTTLLKHLLWRGQGGSGRLPVFVSLKSWRPEQGDIKAAVAGELARISRARAAAITSEIDLAQTEGRLLLLLDGLDEVVEAHRRALRQDIDAWVSEMQISHAGNRALITCRVMSWQGEAKQLQVAQILQVAPFTDGDIRTFVERHFAELPGKAPLAAELVDKLQSSHPRVRELGRNPLLLALLCFYYEGRRDLPRRRVALYEEIINTLLREWRKEQSTRVFADDKEAVLERAALRAMESPERPLTLREIVQGVQGAQVRDKAGQAIDADTVVEEIVTGSGLLVDLEHGRTYTFMHLTLQEYFAARHLKAKGWREAAERHRRDSRWNEVWRLLGAMLDEPGELLATLFPEGVDGDLATAIAEDARAVTQATVERCVALPLEHHPRAAVACSVLGGLLQGWLERDAISLEERQVALEEGVGKGPLRRLYLEVLRRDAELARREGRRLDPMVVYAALSHIERWILREEGAADLRAAVEGWRGPALPEESWVQVPAGTLMMGNTVETDREAYPDEAPIHTVHLKAFRLGRHLVTNEEFAAYCPAHQVWLRAEQEAFAGPQQPVVYVSWWQGWLYARWRGATLPTEAQWEWGARGPRGRKFPWGRAKPTLELANFSPDGIGEGWLGRTSPVGSYPRGASWVGALDLAGNVEEWCQDWLGPYFPGESHNPTGPDAGSSRVLRGGSWVNDAWRLRAANRHGDVPSWRYNFVGFRVALPPPGV